MSFISGILASLLEWFISWLLGAAKKAYQAYETVQAIKAKNQSIEDQVNNAKTEQERKDALRRAAEHFGHPS